jgi:hypothetical protein
MYLTFIRPILEYADVVYLNCTQYEKLELDKIQNEASRIVCGATKLVSLVQLYSEVPRESLESRRNNHMLILFYKMKNGLTPDYLCSLLPPAVGENSRYDLRNATNIQTIRTRTTLYQNAFLPTALTKWNALPTEVQNLRSLSSFKSHLRRSSSSCPIFFL